MARGRVRGGRGMSETIFSNVSKVISNHNSTANGAWPSADEVEHLLGDPDVDHAVAVVLGAVAVVYGRRLPQLLAAVAAMSFGLWTALVIHDRQVYDQPLFGKIHLPSGEWVPIVAGLLAGVLAGLLCRVAWKAALVGLTAGLLVLISASICRLFNVSPDKVVQVAASKLSAYRVVGAVVLVVGVIASALLVKRFHKHMIKFSSAFLGTLLLLSGVSHFSARIGAGTPFSLLDDLARIYSEVRDGNCKLWEQPDAAPLQRCDCQEDCQTEILAWIASSFAVLIARFARNVIERKTEARKKAAAAEERAPLSEGNTPKQEAKHTESEAASPSKSPASANLQRPQVVGKGKGQYHKPAEELRNAAAADV